MRFDRPLTIPILDEGRLDSSGTRVFDLRAQAGRTDLGGDEPSRTWGFNGAYLGPTLRQVASGHAAPRHPPTAHGH